MEVFPTTQLELPPSDPQAPSRSRTFGLVVLSYSVFYLAIILGGGAHLVGGDWGDNAAYLKPAAAIRHWQFAGVEVYQFWGVSYATAGLSLVTGLPLSAALVVLCVGASLVAVAICHRLWGGWVATFAALLSLDWFQRSLLGGSESLFMALVLTAFLALRHEKWAWAAISGALATVVRPYGLFALIALGLQLLWRKKFRECACATAIALFIGAAYMWPLGHYLGNPFANVNQYHRDDWQGGFPFTLPFVTILHDAFSPRIPLTNHALTAFWILIVLGALVMAISNGDLRRYAGSYPGEAFFFCLYSLALFTYSSREWARAEFPRFALPILPWALFLLYRYLPKRQWVVRTLAVITPMLAAASAFGIRNVAAALARQL